VAEAHTYTATDTLEVLAPSKDAVASMAELRHRNHEALSTIVMRCSNRGQSSKSGVATLGAETPAPGSLGVSAGANYVAAQMDTSSPGSHG